MAEKHVYRFGAGIDGVNATEPAGETVEQAKWIVGGKGANLAEMARIGLPVPPGFTITCQTCMEYANGGNALARRRPRRRSTTRARTSSSACGKQPRRRRADPLLVSVRSGAPISMPGMMDTVLNLGLNDESVLGLAAQTGNDRFAWDSYRRFIQMFANVVMGIDCGPVRARHHACQGGRRRYGGHRAGRSGAPGARLHVQADLRRARERRRAPRARAHGRRRCLPAGSRGAAHARRRAAVFGSWDCERAMPLPQAEQDRRRPGHRRQRAGHGRSATRARRPPPASPSRATPPTGEQASSTATTW